MRVHDAFEIVEESFFQDQSILQDRVASNIRTCFWNDLFSKAFDLDASQGPGPSREAPRIRLADRHTAGQSCCRFSAMADKQVEGDFERD